MSIRNRVFSDTVTVTTNQTGLVVAAWRMPAPGKIKGVRGTAVGTAAGNSFGVYGSGAADSVAADSTTLKHDAAVAVVAADTPVADAMTASYAFVKGEWLYVKVTTGATGYTSLSLQVEVDY